MKTQEEIRQKIADLNREQTSYFKKNRGINSYTQAKIVTLRWVLNGKGKV